MLPEIEKLIELAIVDGQITDKERKVILKKANEFGIDKDEVEMILDGKLHQLEASKQKEKEKVGNIKTCPACGAYVKAFIIKCESCDFEFIETNASKFTKKIAGKIQMIINEYSIKTSNIPFDIDDRDEMIDNIYFERDSKIANEIRILPTPTNKEDLIEFLAYAFSNGSDNSLDKNGYPKIIPKAWKEKLSETIIKSKILFEKEAHIMSVILEYELKTKKSYSLVEIKSKATQIWYQVLGLGTIIFAVWYFKSCN